jgi:Kef-type K+ transport system membrane component KefB
MTHDAVVHLLLCLATLLATAVAFGQVARRCGQPAIVGEILGGVCLGPTLLGRLAPDVYERLFAMTGPLAAPRQAILTAGLLGFLFVAGLEMDVSRLRGRVATVLCVSACGIAIPFLSGVLAVHARPSFFGASLDPGLLALFLGAALSISALPVIARTFMDLGLQRTALAGLALSAAMIDDLVGWSLFAFVSRRANGHSVDGLFVSLAALLLLVASAVVLGRLLAGRLRPWVRRHLPDVAPRLALAAALTFAAGAVVEAFGVHAVFGGFLAGVVLSQGARREDVHDICHAVGVGVLAPLYFASIGLRVDFLRHFDPALVLLVLAIACAGKIGAATAAGRLCGMSARESLALGAALNARGAMEILLAGVALEHALIDERLFVALVVMALATSMMSAPLLAPLVNGLQQDDRRGAASAPATAS